MTLSDQLFCIYEGSKMTKIAVDDRILGNMSILRVFAVRFKRTRIEIFSHILPRNAKISQVKDHWLFLRFSLQFNMEEMDLGAKRSHVTTGSTPSKPKTKRCRNVHSPAMRKPLFESRTVSSLESSHSPNRKVSTTGKYFWSFVGCESM